MPPLSVTQIPPPMIRRIVVWDRDAKWWANRSLHQGEIPWAWSGSRKYQGGEDIELTIKLYFICFSLCLFSCIASCLCFGHAYIHMLLCFIECMFRWSFALLCNHCSHFYITILLYDQVAHMFHIMFTWSQFTCCIILVLLLLALPWRSNMFSHVFTCLIFVDQTQKYFWVF